MTAYEIAKKIFRRLQALDDALSLLHWDASVMMPVGGGPGRGERLAELAGLRHEILTAPHVKEALEDASVNGPWGNAWDEANLTEMRRVYAHATAVPGNLVSALTLAASDCELAWREARPKSDFAAVKPKLAALLALVRESAVAKAEALSLSPYDALLDQYEPGGRAAHIDPLFADLAGFLPALLEEILHKQGPPPPRLEGSFPQAMQEALCRQIMQAVGFDFDHGRLDTSAHPFCGGTPDDVRITTRYDESDPSRALMGILHETGHGLYERGLPTEWAGQPVGLARGMSLHESQSLLTEMLACRSGAFFEFAAPLIRAAFKAGEDDPAWSPEAFRRRATRVAPSFIRVDADEVTYPAHIILRYRLERAMIAGDLSVDDVPGAWNAGFKELMGLEVPNDALGCMQDIHWYDGAFGYFPTYTLGAMTAAQLYESALAAVPHIPDRVRHGDFTPLLAWLRDNVHRKASSRSTTQIITEATGRPLDTQAFRRHLTARYLASV